MAAVNDKDVARIVAALNDKTMSGAPAFLIVEKCVGCHNVIEHEGKTYCKSYKDPGSKWMFGQCNLGTHVSRKHEESKKVNPLKASKKTMSGK